MIAFYKWIVFFIFMLTFQIEAKNSILFKQKSTKKIENFFLVK